MSVHGGLTRIRSNFAPLKTHVFGLIREGDYTPGAGWGAATPGEAEGP
jgi:hypothetical protein